MTLRLLLGDQLNHEHSWFDTVSDDVIYVMMEMRQETDYVNHHIQKIVAFFAAMRSFSEEKTDLGHKFVYLKLDDERNTQSLTQNISWLIQENEITKFEYQLPDEYRLDEQLKRFCESLEIESSAVDSEHFLTKRDHIATFFAGKKTMVMENFYRSMRKEYNILMDGDEPATGQWNFDAENRKKLPKGHVPAKPLSFEKDVSELTNLIRNHEIKTIGNIDEKDFIWATTRKESLELLDFFVNECLENFGTFEDSMAVEHWSIYHSR
ncbi:MAG: cryptochrome/photolyase family protein, partial [Spirosomaceae bacterium]|nr:cryptochrome/photolyase family protein [Spirosomataceae bacterium]